MPWCSIGRNDAFLTHIVCRYGVPRELRTDRGSNLVSILNQAIYDQTGVSLVSSTSEHHEALGTVERFQQTLIRMTRTADEGGKYWVSHLPFLLMSYHATKHRSTRRSPAEILLGREMRLPAQLGADVSCPAITASTLKGNVQRAATPLPAEVKAYATRIHEFMIGAWAAAHSSSVAAQEQTVSDTARRGMVTPSYQVGDRVCRLLPDRANKLKYLYSGPYRVSEVLSTGRLRLRDLENNILHDEFDVSNLRPYRTKVDVEALQTDEYIVDQIKSHRDCRGTREYRVKWRGYPISQSTWEPKSTLMVRCAEIVTQYEAQVKAHSPLQLTTLTNRPQPPIPTPQPVVIVRPPDQYESELLPSIARHVRGQWIYGRQIATPRGQRLQWFPTKHFPQNELDTDHFKELRASTEQEHRSINALTEWEQREDSQDLLNVQP